MNPLDDTQRTRLFKALESNYRGLLPFRNLNRSLVEEYAGSGYGRSSKVRQEKMLNLTKQAVRAYAMSLAANRPRVAISTEHRELTYFAKQFEVAVNNLLAEIGLEYTIRQWVMDAFFCVGIVKVHMADAGTVQIEQDLWADPGTPFASNVNLDNWCCDLGARKWTEMKFSADAYRIPFDDLKNSGVFDPEAIQDLQPTSKYSCDDERLSRIGRGGEVDHDEFEPMIDLADVWIPRDGMIYTFAVDTLSQFRLKGEPIAAMPWEGAEFGPYHLLGFDDVPENILPSSPAADLWSLDRLANALMRKQSRRARAQKRLHTYTDAGGEDAGRLQKSSDDEWIKVRDPDQIGQVDVGGVDPGLQAFFMGVTQLYDRMAGNLTAILGLGSQADTASQESMIHSAVSKQEAQMQYRVVDAAVRVIRDLGYMLWADKFKVIRGQMPVEGAEGYAIDMTWTPEDREGDFFDYNFSIDVHSMPYQAPAQKVGAVNQLLTQIYAPLAQLLAQQGGSINLQKLTELYAEQLNLPRLKEIVQFGAVPTDETPIQGRETPMPSASTRTYVRKNVPTGGTNQGREHVQMQAWLGQAATPQQNASMGYAPEG